jgi:hypothetical protein
MTPVGQSVAQKIQAPSLIGSRCRRQDYSLKAHPLLGFLVPQRQAFQTVEPVNPLAVDLPTFAAQQYRDALVAIAHAGSGNIFDAHSQGGLILGLALVIVGRSVQADQATGMAGIELIADLEKLD